MVAGTVDKGGPLAPSPDMAMEFIRIRTAQQYPTLMPTLFPGKLATQEKPYDSLAALGVAFAHLKHNTSPAIDGDAFSPANKGLRCSYSPCSSALAFPRDLAQQRHAPFWPPRCRFGYSQHFANPFPSRSVRRRLWSMALRRSRLRHSLHGYKQYYQYRLVSVDATPLRGRTSSGLRTV